MKTYLVKRNTAKRSLSVLLALVLLLALAPAALADGETAAGGFTDVPEGEWYVEELEVCVDAGLLKGKENGRFAPNDSITLAECLAIAARIYSSNAEDGAEFVQGPVWYQVYVDYALENGIIKDGEFAGYDVPATRRQFAGIMAHALENTSLTWVSRVEDGAVPDMEAGSAYYDEIYSLYREGILTGSEGGAFHPEDPIARCEVAAIAARSVDPGLLQRFMLTDEGFFNCYEGGIGFKVPDSFVLDSGVPGLNGYTAMENGVTSAALVILSQFMPMSQEDFEANREELAKAVAQEAAPTDMDITCVEGTLLGFPSVTLEYTLEAEPGEVPAAMSYRVDILFNTHSSRMVAVIMGCAEGSERDYMALYEKMLDSARVDTAAADGGNVRPEIARLVEEIYDFLADYTDLYARAVNAPAEDFPALEEEYLALEQRAEELEAALSAIDSTTLNADENLLFTQVMMELFNAQYDSPLNEIFE